MKAVLGSILGGIPAIILKVPIGIGSNATKINHLCTIQ